LREWTVETPRMAGPATRQELRRRTTHAQENFSGLEAEIFNIVEL